MLIVLYRAIGLLLAISQNWKQDRGRFFYSFVSRQKAVMSISFDKIKFGAAYSRNTLADLWGYASYHAIARGVVTPQYDQKIILFVTEHKQESLEQYADHLEGNSLHWEGPNDHFGEQRMLQSHRTGDEIHLFYRVMHHTDFTYMGKVTVMSCEQHSNRPSRFVLAIGCFVGSQETPPK